MSTPEPSATHFLQYFFAEVRARAESPLLCEKQGAIFHTVTHRETASRLADIARALSACDIQPGDRVTLHAAASPALLIGEWATLACRGVAVNVPRSFSPEDLIETLVESKSKLIILDRLATGYHLAAAAARLPDLRHIVCFEGGAQAELPISGWADFVDAGRRQPDRSTALVRAIAEKDTALMFYYKDDSGALQAARYSHAQLLDFAARIDRILGVAALRPDELVLTATAWEQAIGHIATCYAPVLKSAVIQLTHGIPDATLFENAPQVVVGDTQFFDGIRHHIVEQVRQSGQLESFLLERLLRLSKQHYETPKGVGLLSHLFFSLLKSTVRKKIKALLGGRLRLFVGTDDGAHYDTQLFFNAFGIELIELPEEAFR